MAAKTYSYVYCVDNDPYSEASEEVYPSIQQGEFHSDENLSEEEVEQRIVESIQKAPDEEITHLEIKDRKG